MKLPLLFLFSFLLLFSLVSAVPPVTSVQQYTEGYVIEDAPIEFLKQNEAYTYNFFLYNISNGKRIYDDTVTCTFYMAESNGEVITISSVPSVDGYYSLPIAGGNFSNLGKHPYGTFCNSSTLGGPKVGVFEVVEDNCVTGGTALTNENNKRKEKRKSRGSFI